MEVKKLIGSFSPEDIVVIKTNKNYVLPNDLRNKSEEFWQNYLNDLKKRKVKVWEGIVYRLEKIEKKGGIYKIYLGTVGYKDHVVTSFLKEDLSKISYSKRPNGMFVTCYLQTTDKKYIFGEQILNGVKKLKMIGGILNQDEMVISSGEDLFGFFLKEMKEETGLDKSFVTKLQGVGFFIMPKTRVNVCLKGEMFFTFDEFIKKARPNYEHDSFVGLTKKEVLESPLIDEGVKKVFGYVN